MKTSVENDSKKGRRVYNSLAFCYFALKYENRENSNSTMIYHGSNVHKFSIR